MPGINGSDAGTPSVGPVAPDAKPGERVVSEEDKKLAASWRKKITDARALLKDQFDEFDKNRRLLAGKVDGNRTTKETVRANLHFANMAQQVPQIYAKDPEFSCKPTQAVGRGELQAAKAFARTAEIVITKEVVKGANLKKVAKKIIRSTYPTSVGWLKASWQEKKGQDPIIANQLKDTQDNIARVEMLLAKVQSPAPGCDEELELAQLKQTLAGLEGQPEVVVTKGITLDFVMSEDIVVLDTSIRSVTDYPRARAIEQRVFMSPEQYETMFGYKPEKAKLYSEQAGQMAQSDKDKAASLVCVSEVWDQDSNRVYTLCEGEDGFCCEAKTPEWTGKRWYPFFLVAFNEIDGSFYPLSDVGLAHKLVTEYNATREDFVRDRKGALPINAVRKGGALTDEDVKKIANRQGSDVIVLEGMPGTPLNNDIFSGQLSKLDPASYDTTSSRYDMERLVGGSDSSTGSITKAKTLGEAEILQRGLQSRNAERRDTMEDMFNELGPYCLEILLRKLSEEEVRKIAGPDATWPQMDIEGIFNLVALEVRGGSTGKPDQLAEQEQWSKLLPVIQGAVEKVAELRAQGQEGLAQAVIEITRETLRRFDERLDIEQFLPKPAEEGQPDPAAMQQENTTMKEQLKTIMAELQDYKDKVDKGMISAAASIATSSNPATGAIAFQVVLNKLDPSIIPTPEPEMPEPQEPPEPGEVPEPGETEQQFPPLQAEEPIPQ